MPLALSPEGGADRSEALKALRRAKRRYQVVCESGSMSGLMAAVDAGIAVGVFAESIVPESAAILRDDLPPLPEVDVALVFADGRPTEAVEALAGRLKTMARR